MMSEPEVEAPPEAPPAPPAPVADEDRVRYEDDPSNFPAVEGFVPAELSAPEVDPELARKDETTVLATDPPKFPDAE
jgi:hypothetical protein